MEDPESGDETSVLKWMLNKGYGIGKKMVITGVIVSSAPLVLPPLVVFSAMGVAFSVPFGLVFATYACTNKLMTKLLPTPKSPQDQEEKEQQLEDIKQGFEGLDDYMQIEGGGINVDEKGYYTDEDNDPERENREDEEEQIGAEIRFELADDGYGKKLEVLTKNVDENVVQEGQKYERIKNIVRGKNVVIEEKEKEQMEDTRQGIETRVGMNVAGDEHVQGPGSIRNLGGGGGVDEKGYEEDVGEYLEGDDEDSLEEERKEAMEDETEEIVKGSTGLLEKIRDEGMRNININNAGDKMNESAAKDNVDIVMPLPPLDSNNVKVASTDMKVPSREGNLDEKKIWEKLGAMRAIVGYKAPSAATYIGELNALYAFTGVEPPASFKGDSDLNEVNANLKFLMSIVGVK